MGRTPLALLMMAGLLLFGTAHSQAQDEATRKEIETQYTQIAQEIQKGVSTDSGKVTLPDFKYMTILGKEGNREQWASEVKKTTSLFKAPEAKLTLNSVTVKADTATALFNTKFTGEGTLADGRTGMLDFQIVERTLWAKGDGGWKLKAVKHVWQESRIDKRLIPFKAPMGDEEVTKTVQQTYGLLSDIYTKQDWDALEKIIPEELPVIDISGAPLSKFDLMERLRAGARLLVDPVVFFSVLQLGHDGETVKVARLATIIANVKLPGGQMGRLQYINVARDTFVKEEKKWVSKKTEEIHADAYLDGKPLPLSLLTGK